MEHFNKTWPYYKDWFVKGGTRSRPGFLSSLKEFENYMPELVPVFEKLSDLAGGGDLVSRYLLMYCPPAFMSGCTQVSWEGDTPMLLRNYDYNPSLFEGNFFKSNWLKKVIGMADCNWGLLDGMNEDGLALSLTFGGRKAIGEGFGIPIIMRYVLETCSNVKEAEKAFSRVPCHMVYNVTAVDKKGDHRTFFLGPDRNIGIKNSPICTNHQEEIDWPEYASRTGTQTREDELINYLELERPTNRKLVMKFLRDPLYVLNAEQNYGTLYTAAYFPEEQRVDLFWPGKEKSFSMYGPLNGNSMIKLGAGISGKLTM